MRVYQRLYERANEEKHAHAVDRRSYIELAGVEVVVAPRPAWEREGAAGYARVTDRLSPPSPP